MDNIYERIDNLSNEQSRAEITSYLKALLPALSGDLERSTSAAYAIAGLMATTYAHNLKDDDPIDEILYTGIQGLTLEPKNLIQGLTLELSSIRLGDVDASTIVLSTTGTILSGLDLVKSKQPSPFNDFFHNFVRPCLVAT